MIMRKILIVFFTAAVLFTANNFAQSAPPENDFQFWNDTQISFPLIKTKDKHNKEIEKLSFFISGTLRFGRNYTHFVDERIGGGFEIFVNKYLTLAPNYLYRAAQPYAGRKEYEHRLRFDASLEKKWSSFSIKDRNRIEYRIRNAHTDSVRYRNKIQLKIPVVSDKKEIFAPFVATEPFYDFEASAWTRNELSAGISKKFTPKASADFFYLWQHNRGNVLRNVNALGISLKFKVD